MLIAPLGVQVPSTIEDLTALFVAGFVKWNGSAFVRADAVEDSASNPFAVGEPLILTVNNLPNGTNVIPIPIPAGYRAVSRQAYFWNNGSAAAVASLSMRRAGIDYQIRQSLSVSLGSANTIMTNATIFLPGDSFVVTNAADGFSLQAYLLLVPDTADLKLISQVISVGDNTIYTCPVGKRAFITPLYQAAPISYSNNSGGTRIYSIYVVPSGQSVGVNYLISRNPSVPNGTGGALFSLSEVAAGGSLILNSDGGTNQQLLGLIMKEIDA